MIVDSHDCCFVSPDEPAGHPTREELDDVLGGTTARWLGIDTVGPAA